MEELNLIRVGFTVNLLFDAVGVTLFFPLVYVIFKYKSTRKKDKFDIFRMAFT